MGTSLVFPTVLFFGAAALLAWHMRTWRAVQENERDQAERDFQWRRYRRRMQASGMLALVAVAMAVGVEIPWRRFPSLYVYYWCGVVLLLFWLCALAIADMVATRARFWRLRREHLVEQAKLSAQLERHRQRAAEEAAQPEASGEAPRQPR
jgi:4-hydroxybenzoate polyprenyltransferase